MSVVYILKSKDSGKVYIDYAVDLKKRLEEHKSGKSAFCRKYRDWGIIYSEIMESERAAIERVTYLKSPAGRQWIARSLY
mgnify:CR=1 FL=1